MLLMILYENSQILLSFFLYIIRKKILLLNTTFKNSIKKGSQNNYWQYPHIVSIIAYYDYECLIIN